VATIEDNGTDAARLSAFNGDSAAVTLTAGNALDEHGPATTPWPAPRFAPIPDPLGPRWRLLRVRAHDSRAELQALIDRNGLVRLPAGQYFISAPLRLHDGQGLIGAGAGRTVIAAMSSDIDLIVGDDHLAAPHVTAFALVDITLQGGRAGIRHDERGSGPGAQYNLCYLSHVVFRDMSEAGIVVTGIFGWDNNLLDNLTFHHMPVGILQMPSAAYLKAAMPGDVPGMNYMDKNVCYRCRFDTLSQGMHLIARRANGLNACIDCRFEHNRDGAMELFNNLSTIIANSDFVDNGGDPVIKSNLPVGITGSRFTVGGAARSILDDGAICEGCSFSRAQPGPASLSRAGARIVMLNSVAADFLPGRNVSALLLQSTIGGDPVDRGRLVEWANGRPRVLLNGTPHPTPRLLVNWND